MRIGSGREVFERWSRKLSGIMVGVMVGVSVGVSVGVGCMVVGGEVKFEGDPPGDGEVGLGDGGEGIGRGADGGEGDELGVSSGGMICVTVLADIPVEPKPSD